MIKQIELASLIWRGFEAEKIFGNRKTVSLKMSSVYFTFLLLEQDYR
jgi:hypothetical protein